MVGPSSAILVSMPSRPSLCDFRAVLFDVDGTLVDSLETIVPGLGDKRFSGAPYVDVTVCSSDVVNPKPDPESALLACKRLGVAPADSVFVGDSVLDLRCARNAGTACVAVAYGAGHRNALLEEEPDLLFAAPEELLAWAQDAFLQTSCHAKS